MKRLISGVIALLSMLFVFNTGVYAQGNDSIQQVINEIEEVAETKEEIKEELDNVTMGEVNEIEDYLENKEEITKEERLILETIREVLYGEDVVSSTIQRSMKKTGDRQSLQEQFTEKLAVMGYDEVDSILIATKSIPKEDRTEEESMLREVALARGVEIISRYRLPKVFIGIAVGIAIMVIVKLSTKGKEIRDSLIGTIGMMITIFSFSYLVGLSILFFITEL